METYVEMKARHQKDVNEFPFFFAFSNKQFDEGMRRFGLDPSDTDKIYKLGNTGGFYKRTDSNRLKEMFDRHDREMQEAMNNDEFVQEMFEYEMGNHEYQITYDNEEVVEACGLDINEFYENERMNRLFAKAKKNYLKLCEENNW